MDDIACKEHEELTPGCVTCQEESDSKSAVIKELMAAVNHQTQQMADRGIDPDLQNIMVTTTVNVLADMMFGQHTRARLFMVVSVWSRLEAIYTELLESVKTMPLPRTPEGVTDLNIFKQGPKQ